VEYKGSTHPVELYLLLVSVKEEDEIYSADQPLAGSQALQLTSCAQK